jgi:hypothetical protein
VRRNERCRCPCQIKDQDFPRELDAVTAEWLSSVLKKDVRSFHTTPLEMGALSDLGLLKLTYGDGDKGGTGPASIVVKFAKGLDANRDGAVATNACTSVRQLKDSLAQNLR